MNVGLSAPHASHPRRVQDGGGKGEGACGSLCDCVCVCVPVSRLPVSHPGQDARAAAASSGEVCCGLPPCARVRMLFAN